MFSEVGLRRSYFVDFCLFFQFLQAVLTFPDFPLFLAFLDFAGVSSLCHFLQAMLDLVGPSNLIYFFNDFFRLFLCYISRTILKVADYIAFFSVLFYFSTLFFHLKPIDACANFSDLSTFCRLILFAFFQTILVQLSFLFFAIFPS